MQFPPRPSQGTTFLPTNTTYPFLAALNVCVMLLIMHSELFLVLHVEGFPLANQQGTIILISPSECTVFVTWIAALH